MRQPWPAILGPPMMQSSGTKHIVAADRSVLERDVEREVAQADLHARGVARDQCAGDAQIRLRPQQLLGVIHPEGQAHHGRDRGERDVALGEIELQANDLLALPAAAADDARVRDGRRVRADRGPVSAKHGTSSPRARRGR